MLVFNMLILKNKESDIRVRPLEKSDKEGQPERPANSFVTLKT